MSLIGLECTSKLYNFAKFLSDAISFIWFLDKSNIPNPVKSFNASTDVSLLPDKFTSFNFVNVEIESIDSNPFWAMYNSVKSVSLDASIFVILLLFRFNVCSFDKSAIGDTSSIWLFSKFK